MEQLKDDLKKLELMLNDTKTAPKLYQPTNYWAYYENKFLPGLRATGLKDFRRKRGVGESFGATDLLPHRRTFSNMNLKKWYSIPRWVIDRLSNINAIKKAINHVTLLYNGISYENFRLHCFDFAKIYGEKCGAKPITKLNVSLAGNPEDVFTVDGKHYTMSILYYYLQYAYCSQFLQFDSINTMAEIGSGGGKQIEVIKKLHPNISFYIFEIPPQLYVCEQYLSAVFPRSVISYYETRKYKSIPKKDHKGKIFILPTWKIGELADLNYDLFWNSASFQEMEPNVVLNFLKYINKQCNYAFLHEQMSGKRVTSSKREHGVIQQTKTEHYREGLKDFKIDDISRSIFFLNPKTEYKYSFWSR